jgi:transcriptional regulator with XRE-family HTH domain
VIATRALIRHTEVATIDRDTDVTTPCGEGVRVYAISGIGRRIAYWRNRRGLTQADFARLMGRSVRWVEDIETGHRQADPRLSLLTHTSAVLHVGIDRLLPEDHRGNGAAGPDPLAAVCAALRRADLRIEVGIGTGTGTWTGAGARAGEVAVGPDPVKLRQELAYGWTAYDAGDYLCLDRVLAPVLIATGGVFGAFGAGGGSDGSGVSGAGGAAAISDGAHAVGAGSRPTEFAGPVVDRSLATAALRADALGLASAAAGVFGRTDLAWRAADRAVTAAGRSGDVAVLAHAAYRLTRAMIGHEGEGPAAEFAREVDLSLAEATRARGASGRAALRALRLGAALATARLGDRGATRDLLDAAERADPGTAHVALYRVTAHFLLGDYGRAIAGRFEPRALAVLPRGRQARHLVDVARALAAVGRRAEAILALLDAEAAAAQEIRCRPVNRRFVEDLIHLNPATDGDDSRLRALAARCLRGTSGAAQGSPFLERALIQ